MKKLMLLAVALVLGGLVGFVQPARAADALSATVTPQQDSMNLVAAQNQPGETFVGKIAKVDGKLVLQSGGAAYELDNQGEAAQYEGKNVKITGTLDPNTNTIRVQKIEAA